MSETALTKTWIFLAQFLVYFTIFLSLSLYLSNTLCGRGKDFDTHFIPKYFVLYLLWLSVTLHFRESFAQCHRRGVLVGVKKACKAYLASFFFSFSFVSQQGGW